MWIPQRCQVLAVGLGLLSMVGGCGDDNGTSPTDGAGANRAPVIESIEVNPAVVAPGDTAEVSCVASDADGDQLTFGWGAADGTLIGEGDQVRWIPGTGDGAHAIAVSVADGRGGVARDTSSADVLGGTLLVQSRDGLLAVDAYGQSRVFSATTASVEVLGGRIFVMGGRSIKELDHGGEVINTVQISNDEVSGYDFTILPDGGFAFLDNNTDLVHFMDPEGTHLISVVMPDSNAANLQNVDGVVEGGRLIVSENGRNDLLSFDLTTHEASIYRSLRDNQGWLGAIDYYDGMCYICRSQRVQCFAEGGELQDLCTLPAYNITGIVAVGSYVYAVLNFDGSLYRIHRTTGKMELLLDGLDYPQDIEYLPTSLQRT